MLQVSITSATGVGNEVIGQGVCRWTYAVEGKHFSICNMEFSSLAESVQWWLSFTKRKFMGKSL